MPEQDDTPDVTRDPETGRITIHRAGTYRIGLPSSTEKRLMPEPLFNTAEHAAAWRKERIDVLEETLAHERKELADCTRDCQRVNVLLAEEEDRAESLEAALRALVAVEPLYADREDWENCVYCEASLRPSAKGPLIHTPDCPWVAARALLSQKEEG